jgi:alpha,alpha-trehalose phosphorylase
MAGTWMVLVYGFGGLSDDGGHLSFRPRLPRRWTRLRFSVSVRGQLLDVEVSPERVEYRLREGAVLEIDHEDTTIELRAGETVRCQLGPVPVPRIRPWPQRSTRGARARRGGPASSPIND